MDPAHHALALLPATAEPSEASALAFMESAVIPRSIPKEDLGDFHKLTARNQMRVLKLLEAVAIIERDFAHGSKMAAYQNAANHLAGMKGASAMRLRVMYANYKATPPKYDGTRRVDGWRALIDYALEWKPASKLPEAFLAELQRRVDANKRSPSMAIEQLRLDFMAGASIPGYGTWRQWWKLAHPSQPLPAVCPDVPPGWSLRNLRNYLDTSTARRVAQVVGLAASKSHTPLVYTTRRGLHVGAVFQFDDLWHDFFVACPGIKKAGRPLEFFCHDLASARKVRFGFRIRTEDDTGKMEGLTLRMMRMLLASVMACDGYSPRGTRLVVEHGTAAIPESVERLLYDASGGLITVHRSGMQGAAAHDGQYGGIAKGNPRHKASLESSNKTVHNLTGAAPGQTGTNRDVRPEELGALLKYNDQLMHAAATLPPHLQGLLRLPLLTEEQAGHFLAGIYAQMDRLPTDGLEGWQDNTIAEAFVLNQWLSAEAMQCLPPHELQVVMACMDDGTARTRQRRLTRGEVWARGSGELVKLSGSVLCHILGDDFAHERTVRSHRLDIQDKELGAGLHRFEAIATDAEGMRHELKNGERYLVTVNPFASDHVFVRDAKGRFIGTAARIATPTANDVDAIHKALGEAAKRNAEILEPLRKRQLREAKDRRDLMEHNLGLIEGHAAAQAAVVDDSAALLAARATRRKSREQRAESREPEPAPATVADW